MNNSKPILLKSLISKQQKVHPLFEGIEKISPDKVDVVDEKAGSGEFLVYLESTSSGPLRWKQVSAKLVPIKDIDINDGVPENLNGEPWTKAYSPAFDPQEEKPLQKQSFFKKLGANLANIFKADVPLPQISVAIDTQLGKPGQCILEYRPELGEFRGAIANSTRTDMWLCRLPGEAQKLAQLVARDPKIVAAFKDVPGGIQSKITKETFTQAITYVM